jgi:hypothetical protein
MTRRTSFPPVAAEAPDGSASVRLRVLSPQASQLHEHLARLDDRDRRERLGRVVAPAAVEAYCTRARVVDPLIVGGFVDGALVASAELFALPEEHFGAGRTAPMADLLMAIEPGHRGRGLAIRLAGELIRHGASRRIALVRMEYDPANMPMARVSARLGAVHNRAGKRVRAELCTGWIGDGLVPPLAERRAGFRPLR